MKWQDISGRRLKENTYIERLPQSDSFNRFIGGGVTFVCKCDMGRV